MPKMLSQMPLETSLARETGDHEAGERDARSPADCHSRRPAPHACRGHRAELRYRARMQVRRRHQADAGKVRGRRGASAQPAAKRVETIWSGREKTVQPGNHRGRLPKLRRIADLPRDGARCEEHAEVTGSAKNRDW